MSNSKTAKKVNGKKSATKTATKTATKKAVKTKAKKADEKTEFIDKSVNYVLGFEQHPEIVLYKTPTFSTNKTGKGSEAIAKLFILLFNRCAKDKYQTFAINKIDKSGQVVINKETKKPEIQLTKLPCFTPAELHNEFIQLGYDVHKLYAKKYSVSKKLTNETIEKNGKVYDSYGQGMQGLFYSEKGMGINRDNCYFINPKLTSIYKKLIGGLTEADIPSLIHIILNCNDKTREAFID